MDPVPLVKGIDSGFLGIGDLVLRAFVSSSFPWRTSVVPVSSSSSSSSHSTISEAAIQGTTEEAIGEIFSQTGQVTATIANLFDQFVDLFNEPEKATLSEAKAADNKIDHLKQIVEDATKQMGEEEPQHDTSVEGENQFSSKQ